MQNDFARTKAALRRQLREKLRDLPAEHRTESSAKIRERLDRQPVWREAQTILLYAPTASEPDLWPLLVQALEQGRRVALPQHSPVDDSYVPRLIHNPARDLRTGRFGIPEPASHCPALDIKQLDLALVPGIGFTLNGGRLGRGKGYFDRLLAEVTGFKCGVAFDCQLIDALPLEPHDVRLNCILTPTRWHSCRARL